VMPKTFIKISVAFDVNSQQKLLKNYSKKMAAGGISCTNNLL